jgi:N-methylhydantoinase A
VSGANRRVVRVGIDTGGTFTDLVVAGRGGVAAVLKVRSTPGDPARAVREGLRALGLLRSDCPVIHGTTVGTNAFLQRRGGRAALVATAGFEDLLVLGRQARPLLYVLDPPPRRPLLPRSRRLGVEERCGARGETLIPLKRSSLARLRSRLRRMRVDAVAVCLLHSYANPDHEEAVGRFLRDEGWHLSLSHRVAGEFREYERTCTTVANAQLARPLRSYLTSLGRTLGSRRLKIMGSSAGWMSGRQASADPVRTVLSGPAGGALAAMHLGRSSGFHRLITLDMGGTSSDVSLCDGRVPRIHGTELDGIPLRIPALDIQSVGAGGGSIARVDPGGALRVGPESAGADPGPACYGRGGKEATLTDALLVLGRLPAAGLLGGEFPLDRRAALRAVERLSFRLRISPTQAALGIVRVVDAALERAVRRISAGRGHHPGRFSLLVFGGAGALQACALASALGIGKVLIPPDPGAFSALGLCTSAPAWEVARTVMIRGTAFSPGLLERRLRPLEREAVRALRKGGSPGGIIRLLREADLRYRGQSHELSLPVSPRLAKAFHEAHRAQFGSARPGGEIELVNLRVRAEAPALPVRERRSAARPRQASPSDRSEAVLPGGKRAEIPVFRRQDLRGGEYLRGPAMVTEYSATTWVAPGYLLETEGSGTLGMRPEGRRP